MGEYVYEIIPYIRTVVNREIWIQKITCTSTYELLSTSIKNEMIPTIEYDKTSKRYRMNWHKYYNLNNALKCNSHGIRCLVLTGTCEWISIKLCTRCLYIDNDLEVFDLSKGASFKLM